MTKEREALTLALEALENGMKFVWTDPEREAGFVAIDAIKEALAQPEQEPVAFYNPQNGGFYWAKPTTIHAPQAVDIVPLALYTSSPQREWVGLTDDDIHAIWNKDFRGWISRDSMEQIYQSIEAKLKEKNT